MPGNPKSAETRLLRERASSFLLQRGLLPQRSNQPEVGRLILFYNSMFGEQLWRPDVIPQGFEIDTDLRRFEEARAVVFHLPSLGPIDRLVKRPGQDWVAWWVESDEHVLSLADPELMARFDLKMTYHLDADIPQPYLNPIFFDERKLRAQPRPKSEFAALFLSGRRDSSGRTEYARELMERLEVHSFGRLLHNRNLAVDRGRDSKRETIARYKFTLSFENSIAPDYVTEKLYEPLVAGSVPVYLGAPNVESFAPSRDCYIDVADFTGPKELAAYLLDLDSDDSKYAQFFAWKERPFSAAFERLMSLQRTHPFARLCERLADLDC